MLKVFVTGLLLTVSAQAAMTRGFNQLFDAVVRIDVREVAFEDGAKRLSASIGSGVILSKDGLILTNAHVASPRAVELSVTLASLERVSARLVGWDHWTDLAVLQIDLAEVKRRGLKFTHAEFGNSDDLFVGQTVYAVGTPFGLTRTATRGIISNNRRYFEDNRGVNGYETGSFNTWLQTDAAINPGNSGGPLVGEIGLGQCPAGGGDILLAVNGVKVDGRFPEQLPPIQNMIASMPVGSPVKLSVKRGPQTTEYSVVTEKLESRVGEEWVLEKWGLSVRKVTRTYARDNQLEDATGVLVIGVQPGFPADVAGLSRGDIITKINRQAISNLATIQALHTAYVEKPAPVLVEAQRNREVSLYVLKP